jgi:hypothetical protein
VDLVAWQALLRGERAVRSFSDIDMSAELIRRSKKNLAETNRYLETVLYLRALLCNLASSSGVAKIPDAPPIAFLDSD